MFKSKLIEILGSPKWAHRSSLVIGLCAALTWLGWVVYVSVQRHLGMPPSDEELDIALVAMFLLPIVWFSALTILHLVHRLHRRLTDSSPKLSGDFQ